MLADLAAEVLVLALSPNLIQTDFDPQVPILRQINCCCNKC